MSSSSEALFKLSHLFRQPNIYPEVKLGDMSFRLARTEHSEGDGIVPIDGKGGFKKVYGLEDGRALAIPNLDTIGFDSAEEAKGYSQTWERAINEEKTMANKVRSVGLEAQHIEIHPLDVEGGASLPAMVMTRFSELQKQGIQIRDVKNRQSSCGTSMLFGTPQNVENAERLKQVLKNPIEDMITCTNHGLRFGSDSINLAIKDTVKTPKHNLAELGLFDERGQQLRLFFFDFSSKHRFRSTKGLELLDATGNPHPELIREHAEHCVSQAYEAVMGGMREEELFHIVREKKNYSSIHQYDSIYDVDRVFSQHYKAIEPELVNDFASRSTELIRKMPMEERLKRFSKSEDIFVQPVQTWENKVKETTDVIVKESKNKTLAFVGVGAVLVGGALLANHFYQKHKEEKQAAAIR